MKTPILINVYCCLMMLCIPEAHADTILFSSYGGNISHGAVRVTASNPSNNMDFGAAPILAPFTSSDPAASRFSAHPLSGSPFFLSWSYLRSTGSGAFTESSASGTTTFGTSTYSNFTSDFSSAGSHQQAAYRSLLTSDITLPGGVSLLSGSYIYLDYAGYAVDVNDPTKYWYDTATSMEYRTFEGGSSVAFYEDASGNFISFARYENNVVRQAINYNNFSSSATLTGTAVNANGWIVPATFVLDYASATLSTAGRLLDETETPFIGMFGKGNAGTLTAHFDFANAVAIPEPNSLLLLLAGLSFIGG